jgi:hypothetical protein
LMFYFYLKIRKKTMNDDGDIPSIFSNNQTTDDPPLFTCALKLDKYDYDKKVSRICFE